MTALKSANQWLLDNGITDIEFGLSKDSYMGKIPAIYEKKRKDQTRRKLLYKSPAFGELTSMVCREYGLDINNRP